MTHPTTESERVLITDGDQRSSLACVRALGKAGYRCIVAGPPGGDLAGRSKYCKGRFGAPDPLEDPDGFVKALLEAVARWEVKVLLPMTEKSLRAVLPRRDEFSGVVIPFPGADIFFRVSDKLEVMSSASRIGLHVPRQWEFDSREELDGAVFPASVFPLVLKPARSVNRLGAGGRQVGVRYARNREDLQTWGTASSPAHFPVLVQQRIQGPGAGVFVLIWDGKLKAVVGHRRIREKPPSGGVSVVRDSVSVDGGLLDQSLLLLDDLGWTHGVAMVEFKMDETTGTPYLMEINGRFWGSLQLAIDAGVDFPNLLLDCARGDSPDELVVGTPGVRTRWLLGDLDQLMVRLLKRRAVLNVPETFPGKMAGIRDFVLDFRPGVRTEVLKFRDPRPFATEVGAWVRALL